MSPRTRKGSRKRARLSSPDDAKPPIAKLLHGSETPAHPPLNSLPTIPNCGHPALTLFGWGNGAFNQLGLGLAPTMLKISDKPKRNPIVERMVEDGSFGERGAGLVAIAAGGMHSLAIDEQGTVWSFGINDDGTLGRETEKVVDPENPDEFLSSEYLEAMPLPVQTLIDEEFRAVQVVAGGSISAALSFDGELRVWGSFRDSQGPVGFSLESECQIIPRPVMELPRRARIQEKIVSITAGINHLLMLTTHGSLYAFGSGEDGQLGRKIIGRRKINGTVPEKVLLGRRSRRAVVIGAGSHHSFAVDDNGDVWGWGLNSMGQTGTGRDSDNPKVDPIVQTPKIVLYLSKEDLGGAQVIQITGGDHHTLFLTSDGRVFACGSLEHGQLGLAKSEPAFENRRFADFLERPTLVTFPVDDPIVRVCAAPRSNFAITAGGVMFAWGEHNDGGLGIGDNYNAPTPTVIVRKDGSWRTESVACGSQHCLALLRKK